MPRRTRPGFIWIPPDRNTQWSCTIAGTDVRNFILSAKFPRGLITEELVCEIELLNSGEDFTGVFNFGDEIIFKMDFSGGNTVQFKGDLEEIKSKIDGVGFNLIIKGSHFTARLLDVNVTKSFSSASISTIRTTLISEFLDGFTSNNVVTNNTAIDVTFENKPFVDCMVELDKIADEDTYVDNDKDFHSFARGTVENPNEAVVWNDSLIELRGLSQDSVEVRNRVKVVGEAGGLPVLHTSNNTGSQSTFRVKEKVISDTSVTDEDEASAIADAEVARLENPESFGSALCYFMPQLNPGDNIHVVSPPHNIHNEFRLVKYVHHVPEERTEVFFAQERSVPKLFKDRILEQLGLVTLANPNNMTHSYNFTYDDVNKIDTSSSQLITISDGTATLKAGNESGNLISQSKTTPITVTQVHLKVIGEALSGTTYSISADGTNNWQTISLDTLENVTNQGTDLRLRITFNSTSTIIDSAVLMYK
ncbi:MAG: hypothetical protein CL811_06615 [Colwelliaceae bacterium]|jgi:hypothetical protein|nr:hypothetical protein [Colwelliaceae bacterium]|tara:strand:- start:6790 stop:8223 length:1434 start_codon:yes stop_codon:yes gene_type:complete